MNENFFDPPEAPAAHRRKSAPMLNIWNALQNVIIVAVIAATLFTMWTPANLFSNQLLDRMLMGLQTNPTPQTVYPTVTPSPRPRIGIVAGHSGNDSGSVCSDGLTEVSVNLKIATMVQQILLDQGFSVDLLQEKDPRLFEYTGLVVVSIHNDSCDYINDQATGFKVAVSMANPEATRSDRLLACMINRYGADTGLKYRPSSITPDMLEYHVFNEIYNQTPAAIIETGFLNLDRQFLTEHTDLVAKGVADGILCFVHNENVTITKPKPTNVP
jgi:N-acetylmuramoyl-L-alanine amidase